MVDCRGGLLDFIADMQSLIRVRQHRRQDGRCIDFDKIDFYDCCGGLLDFIADMHSLIRVRQHRRQDGRPMSVSSFVVNVDS
jgi:hypothetical protein